METPFDQLISSENLQLVKLLIPYTPPETQRFLAVYVKFSELQYTMHFFEQFKKELHTQDFEKQSLSPLEILQEIRPFLPKDRAETFDNILHMMHMMELLETMREMPGSGESSDPGFDPMSMMKTMLTPEQQDMFDMYNTAFSQESGQEQMSTTELKQEGDETHD